MFARVVWQSHTMEETHNRIQKKLNYRLSYQTTADHISPAGTEPTGLCHWDSVCRDRWTVTVQPDDFPRTQTQKNTLDQWSPDAVTLESILELASPFNFLSSDHIWVGKHLQTWQRSVSTTWNHISSVCPFKTGTQTLRGQACLLLPQMERNVNVFFFLPFRS